MFADHDDVWYPQKVEKSLVTIKEKNVDLVYCNANQINEKAPEIDDDSLPFQEVST